NESKLDVQGQGVYELGQGYYKWIITMHVLFFIVLLEEVKLYHAGPASWWWIPFVAFAAAHLIRFWTLISLGRFLNTTMIVFSGTAVFKKRLYRFMRHANYAMVAVEILSFPLIFQAYVTAV